MTDMTKTGNFIIKGLHQSCFPNTSTNLLSFESGYRPASDKFIIDI